MITFGPPVPRLAGNELDIRITTIYPETIKRIVEHVKDKIRDPQPLICTSIDMSSRDPQLVYRYQSTKTYSEGDNVKYFSSVWIDAGIREGME